MHDSWVPHGHTSQKPPYSSGVGQSECSVWACEVGPLLPLDRWMKTQDSRGLEPEPDSPTVVVPGQSRAVGPPPSGAGWIG